MPEQRKGRLASVGTNRAYPTQARASATAAGQLEINAGSKGIRVELHGKKTRKKKTKNTVEIKRAKRFSLKRDNVHCAITTTARRRRRSGRGGGAEREGGESEK